MDFIVMLKGVVPGPACVIPEEKRIFRVTADASDGRNVDRLESELAANRAEGDLPLPVPHMYSA
jgi:hypothetical protein